MVGISWALHSDNAKVYVKGDFDGITQNMMLQRPLQSQAEPHLPW